MRIEQGLSCIRRKNPTGYHYFVSNLQGKDIDAYVTLGVKANQVVFYNPMNGLIDLAKTDAKGRVKVQLKSGESIIIRTFTSGTEEALKPHKYLNPQHESTMELQDWTLSFKESSPVEITQSYYMKGAPKPWTALGDSVLNVTMATGVYRTTFNLPKKQLDTAYVLDLGDVRETAHVLVNGKVAGMLFAVPFRVDITDFLRDGSNTLEIAVVLPKWIVMVSSGASSRKSMWLISTTRTPCMTNGNLSLQALTVLCESSSTRPNSLE